MVVDYLDRAHECLRSAVQVIDPKIRATLIEMAHAWQRLHEQAQRNSQADLSYETPPPDQHALPQRQQQQQQQQQRKEAEP